MASQKSAPAATNGIEAGSDAAAHFARPLPDEAACLEWLKTYMFPAGIVCHNKTCSRHGEVTKHHRVVSRRSYCCAHCGHHVHPTAGTVFHKSPTALRLWFYAIYLMASTDCRIPAREIQRQLGVTYKTAWRMSTQIRALFNEAAPLRGAERPDEPPAGIAHAIACFVEGHRLGTSASHQTQAPLRDVISAARPAPLPTVKG